MIRKVAIVYGLGGGWLDPAPGENYLLQRCKAAGFTVPATPFQYGDSQGIYDFLKAADWRAVIGDSFGASYPPQFVGQFGFPIDYMAGFQPSIYAGSGETITVAANVKVAHCIRDPDWIDTGGLGYATWVAADPKKTRLLITEHRGAHPDDTGYAQDLVFDELKRLAGV